MARRYRIRSKRYNQRRFARVANRTHRRNLGRGRSMRGGIRL